MPTLLTCALLAEDVYHDRPTVVGNHGPISVPDAEHYCRANEFAGLAYAGRDAVGIIAFRGSRDLEDWKGANLEILRRRLPLDQFGCAMGFFASAHRALERAGCTRYLVVGHSLGGGLAALVAAAASWVPVRGVTFNAPGLAQFVSAQHIDLPRPNAGNVFNFRAARDVVSRWGSHIGPVYDVAGASGHGIRILIATLQDVELGGWNM
jgi:pimeloyl-ACP methyl ester carboxylesterase